MTLRRRFQMESISVQRGMGGVRRPIYSQLLSAKQENIWYLRNAVRAIVVCLRSMVDGAMAMVDGAMAMVDGR